MKILYINPSNHECGIYQYGLRVYNALETYLPDWCDCEIHYAENYDNVQQHVELLDQIQPDVVLYSFNDTAMPFVKQYMQSNPNSTIHHIAISHEQEQIVIDNPGTYPDDWIGGGLFKNWIGHDPTIIINRPDVHNATRPVLRSEWKPTIKNDDRIVFGSSGFGHRRKMHYEMLQVIQHEYDEAVIRFNMPPSHFGDKQCVEARAIADHCRSLIHKPGIELQVTYDLLETEQDLVEWMYGNDVNIYFSQQWEVPYQMRGVNSSPDTALSTRRPLIVNQSTMTRHLTPYFGAYGVDGSIKQLIEKQVRNRIPELVYNEWSPARTAGEYYKMIRKVCNK
jgi:hypothetical protein